WHNRSDRAPAQPVSPRCPLRRNTGMIGEVSIGGVYVPSLLLFACAAVILTAVLSRLLSLVGFYPLGGHPPRTRISLFFLPAGRHRLGHESLGAAPMRLLLPALIRWSITALLVLAAIVVALWLWHRYETAPWTRDGHVFADVVRVSPDVSGLVTEVVVHDNE